MICKCEVDEHGYATNLCAAHYWTQAPTAATEALRKRIKELEELEKITKDIVKSVTKFSKRRHHDRINSTTEG